MRSFSRAVIVSALSLPLAFAGAGLATAGEKGGGHEHCTEVSCNSWWQANTTINDQGLINVGIMG